MGEEGREEVLFLLNETEHALMSRRYSKRFISPDDIDRACYGILLWRQNDEELSLMLTDIARNCGIWSVMDQRGRIDAFIVLLTML